LDRLLESAPARWGAALAVAALGGWGAAVLLGYPVTGIDDANITFVYARNLVDGHGLVFTPGYERVEGFTSIAWMLVCSVAFALSRNPQAILLAISVALCAATVYLTLGLVQRVAALAHRGFAPVAWVITLGWLALQPAFYAWTGLTLMDVALWSAVVHALALGIARRIDAPDTRGVGLPLACAAAALTRPESLALVPVLLAVAALCTWRRISDWRTAIAPWQTPALSFAGAALALLAFRLAYFGYPLPNTYYAKVPPSRLFAAREGLDYLGGFLGEQSIVIGPIAVAFLVAGICFARGRDLGMIAVAGMIALGLALPLFGGGDHLDSFRMYQPFVPLIIVPMLWGAAVLWGRAERPAWLAGVAVTGVVAIAAVLGVGSWRHFASESDLDFEFFVAQRGQKLADILNRSFPAALRPTVGEVGTGGMGYAYRGRVVDLMGLNWIAMAHSPGKREGHRNHAAFNIDVFWTDPPDLVNAYSLERRPRTSCQLTNEFRSKVLKNIWQTPRFREHYAPGYFVTPHGGVRGFFRKVWLERANPPGLHVFRSYCDPVSPSGP
jgi:hypothetical protein